MNNRSQAEQFAKARQMAQMSQDILAQLLSWKESERNEHLKHAQATHDDFVSQVMAITDVKARAEFMLTVNPAVQRTLLVHKVWEEMKAQNGGKAPEIKMNEDFAKQSEK